MIPVNRQRLSGDHTGGYRGKKKVFFAEDLCSNRRIKISKIEELFRNETSGGRMRSLIRTSEFTK